MLNHLRCLASYSLRFGIALAVALPLLSVATESRATNCWGAWNSSSASDTCSHTSITIIGNDCQIITSCDTAGGTRSNYITEPVDDVDDLNNCDGVL